MSNINIRFFEKKENAVAYKEANGGRMYTDLSSVSIASDFTGDAWLPQDTSQVFKVKYAVIIKA